MADPAPDGPVWFSGQSSGNAGKLDPKTGKVELIPLGRGSSPHGVILDRDGSAWFTDGGQNAIVKVDARTRAVSVFKLPATAPNANLNTAALDAKGRIWFTGQSGFHGRLDPATGELKAEFQPNSSIGGAGDKLHPNRLGYQAMGNAFDLTMVVGK